MRGRWKCDSVEIGGNGVLVWGYSYGITIIIIVIFIKFLNNKEEEILIFGSENEKDNLNICVIFWNYLGLV